MDKPDFKKQDEDRGAHLSDYWPLLSLIGISVLAASCLTLSQQMTPTGWMHFFMGFFLCSFSMLKIFNLSAFADGFQMYDLLAQKIRFYAFLYPFIELALGLSYLAFFVPVYTYGLTIIIMAFGVISVFNALRKGLDINCPCMGSVLKVPLSTVTLTEDIAMVLMAAIMLMMAL